MLRASIWMLAMGIAVAASPAGAADVNQPNWADIARSPPAIAATRAFSLASPNISELELQQSFPLGGPTGITFWTHPRGAPWVGLCEATVIRVAGYRRDVEARRVYKVIERPPPRGEGPIDLEAGRRAIEETDRRCNALTTAKDFFDVGTGSDFEAWDATRLLGIAIAEASNNQSAYISADIKGLSVSGVTFVKKVRCVSSQTSPGHRCYEVRVTGRTQPGGSTWRVLRVDGDQEPTAVRVLEEGPRFQY